MASVMSMEPAGYNSGKALSQYDIKNLMGGNDGATEIGERVFGKAGHQEIDHSKGGNVIKMHEQYGGTRRRKGRKGSRSKRGKTVRKSPVSGGKSKRRAKGKKASRGKK